MCFSVVLMDELDKLVTAKQDVVYNFFNWPTLIGYKQAFDESDQQSCISSSSSV
jgi:Cdc6-like AAA superfamily ATPase